MLYVILTSRFVIEMLILKENFHFIRQVVALNFLVV